MQSMEKNDLAVLTRGVSKSFGKHRAVSDLDLAIPRGSIYGLLGPNGSGKTTTIRMIMGILIPDAGELSLFGGNPEATRRTRVGYLPEERGVYRKMKIIDLLVFFAEIRGIDRAEARRRAMEWLDRLGLIEWAGKKSEDLSKGMQQKIQFIATVLHEPDLLVLDEPFSGLDPINQDVLEEIVRELNAKGATILFSTHLMDQAERLCERVCLVSRSRKVLDGDLRELKRNERSGAVAIEFVGGDEWLRGPEVRDIETMPEGVRVHLREGHGSDDLLRRGVEAGASIRRFEVLEPRLHEIFVRHAGGEGGEGASPAMRPVSKSSVSEGSVSGSSESTNIHGEVA